jgi:hypothetical protein
MSGKVDSTLSRAWQLSPRKLVKSPKKASLLTLEAMDRLPFVCPFCLKWFNSSLANHICSSSHKDHMFYKEFCTLKEENEPRFKEKCAELNIRGRIRNNIKALELNDRPIIPARRSKKPKMHVLNLVWCTICKKAVAKKSYKETHLATCAKKKQVHLTPNTKTILCKNVDSLVESESVTVARILNTMDPQIQVVLLDMRADRLALVQFVANDDVAKAMLTRIAFNNGGKFHWLQDVRRRLRMLFKVFAYYKMLLGTKITCIMDIMQYDVYHAKAGIREIPSIVECCHAVCEKDEEDSTFVKFNDVMTFSSLLQTVSDIIENHLFHTADVRDKWQKEGRNLLGFLESPSWKMFTVRPAARQKALQVTFTKVIVSAHDFLVYLNLVENLAREHYTSLVEAYAKRNKHLTRIAQGKLVESLPNSIGTFTYRRVSEPFQITLRDFQNRPDLTQLLKDHKARFTTEAANEIEKVFLIESRGKGDKPVISVIKLEWLQPMILLADKDFRAFISIPERNKLVFAKLGSKYGLSHANPSVCQAKFAKMCEHLVANYMHLRTRNFRVSCATRLSTMQLTHTTTKLLCDLFGHSKTVHEKMYELPQPLQMAAYMGFMCHASALDQVSSLNAVSIESHLKMAVDPKDKVAENDK